jgi:type II secretory pathway pseudopilin PulG
MTELIIVVLLVGIITAVSAPRFSHALQRHRIESATKRVALDLAIARQLAKSSGKTVTVSFDQKINSYSISNLTVLELGRRRYTVDLGASPYHCVISSVSFPDTQVHFDRFQRPDYEGKVELTCGKLAKTLTLDAITGEVTIQ